jgi:hypothetical protein
MAISFYNAGDNAIYDSGQHFVPQEKYRLGYTPPATPEPLTNMPVNGGITNTKAFNNSGNDFSVYNPDPNSIVNREYRPNYDYRQFSEYGSDPSTADIKQMDMNQNYFNKPPPSKMEGLMSMIPGAGIAKFLANQIGPYMPTNRRAIMENELSGQGIMVNDIGQIVQGDGAYDTAGNVMAGYNANKLTAESFDKRISMAEKNMSDKNKGARIEALKEAKAAWEKATGRSDRIYDFEEEEKKKNKKNTVINRFLTKKKETKTAADAIDLQNKLLQAAAATNRDKIEAYTGQKMSDYRASRPRSEQNYTGGDTNSNPSTPGAQDSFSNKSGMGRTGYFFGGRVNYKVGGRTDAESQYGADSAGSYDSSQNQSGREQSYGGGNDTKQPALLVKKVDTIDTSGLKSKNPKINIDYTDPRNYASLKGSIYNTNILDNDDINVDGTLSGEFGPVSYNTNFTDQGITGTNLRAGNFSADIDANKNYSLGYANNYNGIDYGAKYDNNGNLMFSAGVNFKNGGLASIL